MNAEDVQAQLRQLAERGIGFDMNPTMMFTTAESMYSQWLDYFTRLDQEWRERVADAAAALSSPPADDVREALGFFIRDFYRANGIYAGDQPLADAIFDAFQVRRPEAVTSPAVNVREALYEILRFGNDGDEMDTVGRIIKRFDVRPHGTVTEAARPYSEAVDVEHGAWETDDIEERAHDLLAVVAFRRAEAAREVHP